MDQASFEEALEHDGYEVGTREWTAGGHNALHSHEFDAKLMVLDGEVTITIDGQATTYKPGDTFAVAAGTEHIEDIGAKGVRLVVGRR